LAGLSLLLFKKGALSDPAEDIIGFILLKTSTYEAEGYTSNRKASATHSTT
jgi:hypothetical protein